MNPGNTKLTSARAFVCSLNILLKFARLYGFDHWRMASQFETAWNELRQAIPITSQTGLLLGASGAQLLLNGMPVEATPAERSFAQLLSAAGLASIQFTSRATKEDLERLVRAFPAQNAEPSLLAGQLRAALGKTQTIRINEIRPVPEGVSKVDVLGAAALLTAESLSADVDSAKAGLRDSQEPLQLTAAEGSRGEAAAGPASREARSDSGGGTAGNTTADSRVANPSNAGIAKQKTEDHAPATRTSTQAASLGARPDIRTLLRGVESLGTRGKSASAPGNAPRAGTRVLGSAGEGSEPSVPTSAEAWCIPPRNVRESVQELIQRGDEAAAESLLQNYASGVQSAELEARRKAAIGLAELADVYASLGGPALIPAIKIAGAQLSVERDDSLQGLISMAFAGLAQEAGRKRAFPALLQAIDSLDALENRKPVFAQSLRPRLSLEKRVPEFLEDVLRGERATEGLQALLQRVPRIAAENLAARFNRTTNRADQQYLVDLASAAGNELLASLQDTLRTGPAGEAAETTGLLSRLDASCLERWLPTRLGDWPRQAQDRVVRLVAMAGAPERGHLLVKLLSLLDPVLLPLAIDEIGLSGDTNCVSAILLLAKSEPVGPGGLFVRLKAVEALGRLKALESLELLRGIAEDRHMFHRAHPAELRLAAVQSLAKIDSNAGRGVLVHSGFVASELSLAPLDPLPDGKYFRRRRYARAKLAQPIAAIAIAGQESNSSALQGQPAPVRLEIRGLSLSGGVATAERHLAPGTLAALRIGSGLRPIRAQVLMRDARAHGLSFEFAEMDLDERARLRKLLLGNKSSAVFEDDAVLTQTRG